MSDLLLDESADVRKAVALKLVISFPQKRIKEELDKYVLGEGTRYYNVISWLDLGASMDRNSTRKVADYFS